MKQLFITAIAMAFAVSLLHAQPGPMGMRPIIDGDTETVQVAGVVRQVREATPETPTSAPQHGDRNHQDDRGGRGPGNFTPPKMLYVDLYSGDTVLIGTKDYWKKLDVALKSSDAVIFETVPGQGECDYIALSMSLNGVYYKLVDDDGRLVWAPEPPSGGCDGRGPGGGPDGGGR